VTEDSLEIKVGTLRLEGQRLTLTFAGDSLGLEAMLRLSARVSDSLLAGVGETPLGIDFTWQATRAAQDTLSKAANDSTATSDETAIKPLLLPFPPVSFGFAGLPEQPRAVFVRGATIWTSGPNRRHRP